MNTISMERTVGELVTERPGRSRVFEKYGIDYCCGGKKPLAEACAKKNVSADRVLQELEDIDKVSDDNATSSYDSISLAELAAHIVTTHHAYLERELPRLLHMAEKVAKVHGERDNRLPALAREVGALSDELEAHMMKEERVLFPVIQEMEKSPVLPRMPFGTLANPIRAMEHEHDVAGNGLDTIRHLTDGLTPPDWACNTYRALIDGLRELEIDLHQHIHKENNILFPKALALENSRNEQD